MCSTHGETASCRGGNRYVLKRQSLHTVLTLTTTLPLAHNFTALQTNTQQVTLHVDTVVPIVLNMHAPIQSHPAATADQCAAMGRCHKHTQHPAANPAPAAAANLQRRPG